MKKRMMALVLGFALAASALAGCGGSGSTSTAGSAGNSGSSSAESKTTSAASESAAEGGQQTSAKDMVVMRVASDNGTIDYHNSTADNVTRLRALICNSLMEAQKDEDGDIAFVTGDESIATEYKFDDDSMGITFTIREGIKFSNGYDTTADDVVFSIKLYDGVTGFDFIDFANIKADGNTVYVPFNYANANVFFSLGVMIPIYSEKYYEELGGEANIAEFYSTSAIGTGPYKLKDWVVGDYIDLEANENYFAGTPIIKNVRIRVIAETSVALMELQTGGIDILVDPAGTDVADVLDGNYDADGISYWEDKGTQQYILGFNCAGVLNDINLRKAICYAMDMDAINQTVYGVMTETASSIMSNTSEGSVDLSANWPYEYDPEKAVEARNAAGYGEGEVELTYLVGGGDQLRTAVGEMMASYLAEAGITMNIVNVDKSAWASMIKEESGWDVHLRGISAVGTTYLDYLTTMLPQTSHIDKTENGTALTEAVEKISSTLNEEERIPLWEDLQESYLTEYLYSVPLSQVKDYTLVSDKLQNAGKISLFKYDFKDAYFTE